LNYIALKAKLQVRFDPKGRPINRSILGQVQVYNDIKLKK